MNDQTKHHGPSTDSPSPEIPRRHFLGSVGATAVMAAGGFSGCIRKPVEHILPYANRPEDLIPGRPMFYATALNTGGHVQGLLIESHEGRPTKVEGNPTHPNNLGAADVWAQASVNDLYDPDRVTHPWAYGVASDWAAADEMLAGLQTRLADSKGEGLAILMPSLPSPTAKGLLASLQTQYPQARLYRHDLTGRDGSRDGMALVGGSGHMPSYDLAASAVILSIDADPLATEGDAVANARGFAQGRHQCDTAPEKMARLYAVEGRLTLTGQNADHRLRLRSSQIPEFLLALAHRLTKKGLALPPGATLPSPTQGTGSELTESWLEAVADDLLANRGRSAIVLGDRQHAHAHGIAQLLNVALGNIGRTVTYPKDTEAPGARDLTTLADTIQQGLVKQLVILGGNPVHTASGEIGFRDLLASVPLSIYLGQRRDETALASTWQLPQAHYLETWGDLQSTDGTSAIQQPLIAPLHGRATSETEVISALVGGKAQTAYDLLRAHWTGVLGGASAESRARVRAAEAAVANAATQLAAALTVIEEADEDRGRRRRKRGADKEREARIQDARQASTKAEQGLSEAKANLDADAAQSALSFERTWRKALHDGVLPAPKGQVATPGFQWKPLATAWPTPATGHAYELDFVLSGTILDGRYGNNGWLQELPDPVSKVTWDNAAMISQKTAEDLAVEDERMLRIATDSTQLTIPVRVMIGIADGTIVLPMGYGSDKATGGRVGGGVGVQVHALRAAGASYGPARAVSTVTATGMSTDLAEYPLPITQRNTSLLVDGYRRPFARVAPVDEYKKSPRFVMDSELPMFVKKGDDGRRDLDTDKIRSLWEEPNQRTGQQWGMTIDLNSCIGCNACTIACQAENNISVVGREEVLNGREMHWIRLDQYFDGTDDDPQAIFQPLGCVHCESAPCEQVCPVGATTHSPEGLNDMAYNRCIGTRYCANNCPFKVRRFNYFNYSKRQDESSGPIARMQRNPDVTVRFRGVIEKCTYCVQRVNQARIDAKRDGDGIIPDGTIDPACSQTCPTQAITFGDINDENSAVAGLKRHPRNYDILAEMNLYPRTSYLARIRNPNPKLS